MMTSASSVVLLISMSSPSGRDPCDEVRHRLFGADLVRRIVEEASYNASRLCNTAQAAWSGLATIIIVPGLTSMQYSTALSALLSIVGAGLIALAVLKLATSRVAHQGLLIIAFPLVLLLTLVGLVLHVKQQSESAQGWALHSSEVLAVSQ